MKRIQYTEKELKRIENWWESPNGERVRLIWFYIAIGVDPLPIAINLCCIGRDCFREMWT